MKEEKWSLHFHALLCESNCCWPPFYKATFLSVDYSPKNEYPKLLKQVMKQLGFPLEVDFSTQFLMLRLDPFEVCFSQNCVALILFWDGY